MGQRNYWIIFWFSLLLTSCAQVGSISGGPEDITPPQLVENGINPPNASLNFDQKVIEFKFKEFIKLNNPNETISLVPADAKIAATIQKKTLKLTLDGNLKPETTYAIYLNGTVQDISEGNDSLMQYVFSTGNFIDTLQYSGYVTDAFTYKPLKDVFVGFYPADQDSIFKRKPSYFSKSEVSGKFNLNYIKPGLYQIIAFEDKNKDMLLQKSERVGFSNQLISIDSTMIDSIPMRIFSQPTTRKINAVFNGPSLVNLGSNKSLDSVKFYLEDKEIPVNYKFAQDSVSLLIPTPKGNLTKIALKYPSFTDTVAVKTFEKDRNRTPTFETNLENGVIPSGKKLEIRFSDVIFSHDTSLIQLRTIDSLKLNFKIDSISPNKIELSIELNDAKELNINLLKNSFIFKNGIGLSSSTINVVNKNEREYGSIILSVDSISDVAFVEILRAGKVVKSIKKSEIGEKILISNLIPDTYTFRAVLDENRNGKWDDGNFDLKKQPEIILFFTNGVKVRANWEMEVKLVPEK